MNDGTKNILICEDNLFVLQLTSFTLEAAGFVVDTAMNTAEIFRKLRDKTMPALILLDLHIPESGGEFVIQQIRNQEQTKNIPIILFSGEEKIKEIADKLKVDGFLRKPYDNKELISAAHKFIPL